jgi:hypothetical protein
LGSANFLVVPLPLIGAMVWAYYASQGEGDDVTGPALFFLGVVAIGAVLAGVLLRTVVRFARSRAQPPARAEPWEVIADSAGPNSFLSP